MKVVKVTKKGPGKVEVRSAGTRRGPKRGRLVCPVFRGR